MAAQSKQAPEKVENVDGEVVVEVVVGGNAQQFHVVPVEPPVQDLNDALNGLGKRFIDKIARK